MAREPGQAGELHGIQMLRGIAALAVLAHHALEESNGAAWRFSPVWLTTLGAAGVDLFFVISGFIMLHVSFRPDRPPERALPFLQRRATRIYPLNWLCCGAMLLLIAMGFLKGQRLDAADIATSLLLVPGHRLVIGVAWTLVFEIGFYLVFAALLPLASATRVVAGATMLFAMLLALASSLPAGPMRAFAANPLTLEFCLGLWLAWAFGRGMRRGGWAPAGLGVGLLIAATVLVPHDSTAGLEGWPRLLGWGLPAALIVAALMARGKPRGVAGRALVALGDASYALYLTHAFVMIAYAWLIKHRGLGAIDQRPIVILVVILAVAIGVATHRLIERPLLGLLRRGRPLLPAAPQDGGAPPTSAALARSPAGAPPPRQGG